MPTKKTAPKSTKKAPTPKGAKPTSAKAAAPAKTPKAAKPNSKLSQLDAAAKVLTESGTPMTTKAMIEAMATKGFWTSPGGATPAQTLYSALIREISQKGDASRFVKADKGLFGLKQ
jgi:hypothetical protein